MKIKYVQKYSDITILVDGPYNPPDNIDTDAFEFEYDRFRSLLVAMLSRYGKDDPRGHGDYSVGYYTGMSRGVGVVLNNKKLFGHEFIDSIKTVVDAFEKEYVVVVSAEHGLGEDVYICITKDRFAQGYAKKMRWLTPFGDIFK
ncbi:hypothetical protein OpiT1DRAFT_05916 [Opitutaceae bacterium TAV1]|nr:hypothetical protein OpiT1DRAFT_05916 [Opitutaceae bacterium TAV1]